MIRSLYYTKDGRTRTDLKPEEFPAALKQGGVLWVDFQDEPPENCEPILLQTFGFHILAVDDALQHTHVPKVDDWDEYLYVVLEGLRFNQGGSEMDTLELDVFLGQTYIVSHHDGPLAAVESVWSACQRSDRYFKRGADHLLYRLADELSTGFLPVVDEVDDAIDELEDHIFGRPEPKTVEKIFALKRAVLKLRRVISPQREVLNRLARDDYGVINAVDRVYFRDVYDHLVRLYDINESLRDLVSGALDTYLSVINNRMNEIMKTLTVVTTLFMPLTFITGYFGMNFFGPVGSSLDPWTGRSAFWLTLTIMLMVPVGMFLWIRRRGWL